MKIKILSKKGIIVEREISNIILPSVNGAMQVLPQHAGSVVILNKGKIFFDSESLQINDGIAKISEKSVLVFLNAQRLES